MSQFDVGQTFAQALRAYEAGSFDEARRLCRAIHKQRADFGGAHYLLGLVALAEEQPRKAVEHLQQAVALSPTAAAPRVALARALAAAGRRPAAIAEYGRAAAAGAGPEALVELARLKRLDGKLDEAIGHCRAALQAKPEHGEWLALLGALLQDAGRPAEAVAPLRRAVELLPERSAALNNLGLACRALGRMGEAATLFDASLQLNPHSAAAHANMAGALRALGRGDEALRHARRAVELKDGNAAAWLELALAERAGGASGRKALEKAARLDPGLAQTHYLLGEAARDEGDSKAAERHFRRYLQRDPDDRHGATLQLAALQGGELPDKAPEAYVRGLFDEYADRFDEELTERLNYRAPDLLHDALVALRAPAPASLDVMDLGCGTGLTGLALAGMARRLDGVDLSPRMVEKAAERGIYAALTVGDLVEALAHRPDAYDLVVAGDVFVYLGDLGPALAAAAASLRPGGVVAFTVERAESGVDLGERSRYAHGRDHLEACAAAAGLTVLAIDRVVPRTEAGGPIHGWLAVMERPG